MFVPPSLVGHTGGRSVIDQVKVEKSNKRNEGRTGSDVSTLAMYPLFLVVQCFFYLGLRSVGNHIHMNVFR